MRRVVREEFGDIGLHIDSSEHQDTAREDLRFLRKFRQGVDGTASKLGWMIIVAFFGGIFWIMKLGFDAWRIGKS